MNIFGMGVSDFILLAQTVVLTITLIVLIWQTRISVKSIKAEQYQNAVRMLFDWSVDILNDEKLVKDYETETYFKDVFEEHGVNKYFHTLKLFHTLEFFYLLYEAKMIDENKWGGCKNNFRATLASKKVRDIWRGLNKNGAWNKDISIFHPAFRLMVDNIIQEIEQNQGNGNEG